MNTYPLSDGVQVRWFEQGVMCAIAQLTPVRFNRYQQYGYNFAIQQCITLSNWTDLPTYLTNQHKGKNTNE